MDSQRGIAVIPGLDESQELLLLRALLQASDYGVLLSDTGRRDMVCNRRFSELFGLDALTIVSSDPREVRRLVLPRLADPQGFERLLDEIYTDPLLQQEDEILLRPPGPLVLRRYTTPVVTENGVLAGRLWTFLDITRTRQLERKVEAQAQELKRRSDQLAAALKTTTGQLHRTEAVLERAQGKLVEAEKLSAAGLVASAVGHDLGNILAPMLIELNLMTSGDQALRTSALEAVREQVGQLSLLVERLAAISRPLDVPTVPVDLSPLIPRLTRLVSHAAALDGIQVVARCPDHLPPVMGDVVHLEQVLLNLMLNGIQALRGSPDGLLQITAFSRAPYVFVSVTDNGPGIPHSLRRRIFEPFVGTRPGGAGLGLYSCRRIAALHGWGIRVRSHEGNGTTFTVTLPRVDLAPSN